MFDYKINLFIILVLSVVCFSADDHNPEKRKTTLLNDFTLCINSLNESFNHVKDSMDCVRYAIINMKLYGEHRIKYPLHSTYYYQELQLFLKYDNLVLPEQFCTDKKGLLNPYCLNYLKIFEMDMSNYESSTPDDENVLSEYDPDDINFIRNVLESSGESSSSQSGGQPSTEEQPTQLTELQRIRTKKKNIMKNALYYHKVFQIPQGFELRDDAKMFFHIKNSYGDLYLQKIAEDIRSKKNFRRPFYKPATFCKKLHPRQPFIE